MFTLPFYKGIVCIFMYLCVFMSMLVCGCAHKYVCVD